MRSVLRFPSGRYRGVRVISFASSSTNSRSRTARGDMPASSASVLWLGKQSHVSRSARSAMCTINHLAGGFTSFGKSTSVITQ